MKAGWEVRPLGEVCKIVNGGTPKSKVASYWGEDVNWLTPKDMGQMKGRHIASTPRKISEEGLNNCSAKLVPPTSIIMSTRAPIGHLAINDEPMAFNQGCRGMVPSDALNPVYLYHFLTANREALNDLGSGATFKELSATNLKSFSIPLPPLEEQQRIVAVLDEAFDGLARARTHAEANLQNARELFGGAEEKYFRELPDATHTTLGEIASFRNGLNYSRTSQGAEVKVVGVGDFKDRFNVPVDELTVTKIEGNLGDDDRLEIGDILAVRSNGNRELIGRTMLFPGASDPVSFSGFTIRIRLNSTTVLPEYLCSFMRTKMTRAALTAGGGGSNISNLNQRLLSSLPVAFPDETAQREILKKLQELRKNMDDLKAQYTAKIQDLDDLRQSLLQKAFAGELT